MALGPSISSSPTSSTSSSSLKNEHKNRLQAYDPLSDQSSPMICWVANDGSITRIQVKFEFSSSDSLETELEAGECQMLNTATIDYDGTAKLTDALDGTSVGEFSINPLVGTGSDVFAISFLEGTWSFDQFDTELRWQEKGQVLFYLFNLLSTSVQVALDRAGGGPIEMGARLTASTTVSISSLTSATGDANLDSNDMTDGSGVLSLPAFVSFLNQTTNTRQIYSVMKFSSEGVFASSQPSLVFVAIAPNNQTPVSLTYPPGCECPWTYLPRVSDSESTVAPVVDSWFDSTAQPSYLTNAAAAAAQRWRPWKQMIESKGSSSSSSNMREYSNVHKKQKKQNKQKKQQVVRSAMRQNL